MLNKTTTRCAQHQPEPFRPATTSITGTALRFILPALLCWVPALSNAHSYYSSSQRPLQGLVVAGFTHGGDNLLKVRFTRGDTDSINAGGEILIGGGLLFRPDNSPLQLQASLNYQVDNLPSRWDRASFRRFPLDLLMFYPIGNHRVGAGLTYHLAPRLKIDIEGSPKERVGFEHALGWTVEYDYQLSPQFLLGLRHTVIDYRTRITPRRQVEGDHLGLMFYVVF